MSAEVVALDSRRPGAIPPRLDPVITWRSSIDKMGRTQAYDLIVDNKVAARWMLEVRPWGGAAELAGFVSETGKHNVFPLVRHSKTLLEQVAEKYKLHRIAAYVESGNREQMRFAKALGFHVEHLDREAGPGKIDLYVVVWRRD